MKTTYIGHYPKRNGTYPMFISAKLPKRAESWIESKLTIASELLKIHKEVKTANFPKVIELGKRIEKLKRDYSNLPDEQKNTFLLEALEHWRFFGNEAKNHLTEKYLHGVG